jgi:hypothetical protein
MIIGPHRRALCDAGVSGGEVSEFMTEATSDDLKSCHVRRASQAGPTGPSASGTTRDNPRCQGHSTAGRPRGRIWQRPVPPHRAGERTRLGSGTKGTHPPHHQGRPTRSLGQSSVHQGGGTDPHFSSLRASTSLRASAVAAFRSSPATRSIQPSSVIAVVSGVSVAWFSGRALAVGPKGPWAPRGPGRPTRRPGVHCRQRDVSRGS